MKDNQQLRIVLAACFVVTVICGSFVYIKTLGFSFMDKSFCYKKDVKVESGSYGDTITTYTPISCPANHSHPHITGDEKNRPIKITVSELLRWDE